MDTTARTAIIEDRLMHAKREWVKEKKRVPIARWHPY
jgi:hypothetical protein